MAALVAAAAVLLAPQAAQATHGGSPLPPAIAFNAGEFRTDFTKHTVPLTSFATGAFRDGIAAIRAPVFRPVAWERVLRGAESVIEVSRGGQARAYPLRVLLWHEIVNDTVGGVPLVVTYCPLCNTAMAFDRRVGGRALTFGVSGKLRNSNLVLVDDETDTWWQQFTGEALVGTLAGEILERLEARLVSWADFRRAHPRGTVLQPPEPGNPRYGFNPYAGSDSELSRPLYTTENADDRRLLPKDRVVLVLLGRAPVAVPLAVFQKRASVTVRAGGRTAVIRRTGWTASALAEPGVHRGRRIPVVTVTENGRAVPFDTPFWFAVAAFSPDVRLIG